MAETAQSGSKSGTKKDSQKLRPKRFDPSEHGGVKKSGWLFLFFGVILPATAMIFETNIHFCARHFFDPFPSPGHVVLFALIPFSNFLVWLGTRRDLSNHYAFMSLISGMAMGVACLYSLMFLPLTPMACLFTLALGFGLLGLAPLLSLPCNWIAGKTVCHLAARKITYFNAHQVEHIGHMIILVMVIAIELPSTLTRVNLSRAAESNPVASRDGVAWLRKFGSQEVLLRACYERSGRATDILGSLYESGHPLNVDEARRIFFRVTGKPFNSVPIPRSARATIQHTAAVNDPDGLNAGVQDEFDLDTDIAGEAVSGVARGLSVSQSKFDGKIDADAALASLDWAFSFTNDSKFDREARAKILLPPHAVVTKATLTVKNVEKPATIMVRSAARARYKRAVVEHKDPLLVSTCGPDQVLVQCFPVRPGETMKVKLQMAAPMEIDQEEKAALVLPAFLERNFQVDVANNVDIQSPKPLTAVGLTSSNAAAKTDQGEANIYHLTGNIDAPQLAGFNSIVEADRDKGCSAEWFKTDKVGYGAEIEHSISRPHYQGVGKLIVLIDGSASMQQFMPQIVEGLKTLPSSKSALVKVVGDSDKDLTAGFQQGGETGYVTALDALKKYKDEGGQDDYAALSAGLTQASATADTSIVWIHAAQPLTTGNSFGIKADLDRAADRPVLFDMQLAAGPNAILSGISGHSALVRVARAGTVAEDLSALFAACSPASEANARPDIKDYQISEGSSADHVPAGRQVDLRLAQIWANQQICRDMQNPEPGKEIEAAMLAHQFQIVSPVSSAIVTDPVPVTVTAPVVPRFAYIASAVEKLNPVDFVRKAKESIAETNKKTLDQLTSLSSAASSSVPGNSPARDANLFDKSEEMKMAASSSPALSANGAAVQTAGTVRTDYPARAAKEENAASPGYFARFPYSKAGSPQLQGATNGSVGGGGKDMSMDNARFRGIRSGPVDPRAAGQSYEVDQKAPVGEDEAAAPEAKIVPEADTWLLLAVIAMVLGGAWLVRRRRVNKA